jgi:hypothetical protein
MTHVPAMIRTIDSALVEMFLASQKNKILSVTFLKTNGEEVTRVGQLRATSRLVGSDRGIAQGEAMKERGQKWLAKPDGKSSSFYLDRVTRIAAGGAVLVPSA